MARFDGREQEGFERLHHLLEQQSYRLASWRTAADDINWRRIFDVNELGGLRVERAQVFEATHGKIFELISEGLVDGLRIDHIDGLADPAVTAASCGAGWMHWRLGGTRRFSSRRFLGDGETLREDWCVDGTTGYEFMNQLSLLQHHPDGFEPWPTCGRATATALGVYRRAGWRASRSSTAPGRRLRSAQAQPSWRPAMTVMTRDLTWVRFAARCRN